MKSIFLFTSWIFYCFLIKRILFSRLQSLYIKRCENDQPQNPCDWQKKRTVAFANWEDIGNRQCLAIVFPITKRSPYYIFPTQLALMSAKLMCYWVCWWYNTHLPQITEFRYQSFNPKINLYNPNSLMAVVPQGKCTLQRHKNCSGRPGNMKSNTLVYHQNILRGQVSKPQCTRSEPQWSLRGLDLFWHVSLMIDRLRSGKFRGQGLSDEWGCTALVS